MKRPEVGGRRVCLRQHRFPAGRRLKRRVGLERGQGRAQRRRDPIHQRDRLPAQRLAVAHQPAHLVKGPWRQAALGGQRQLEREQGRLGALLGQLVRREALRGGAGRPVALLVHAQAGVKQRLLDRHRGLLDRQLGREARAGLAQKAQRRDQPILERTQAGLVDHDPGHKIVIALGQRQRAGQIKRSVGQGQVAQEHRGKRLVDPGHDDKIGGVMAQGGLLGLAGVGQHRGELPAAGLQLRAVEQQRGEPPGQPVGADGRLGLSQRRGPFVHPAEPGQQRPAVNLHARREHGVIAVIGVGGAERGQGRRAVLVHLGQPGAPVGLGEIGRVPAGMGEIPGLAQQILHRAIAALAARRDNRILKRLEGRGGATAHRQG